MTIKQLRAVYAVANQQGMKNETLHKLIEKQFGKTSLKNLCPSEFSILVKILNRKGVQKTRDSLRKVGWEFKITEYQKFTILSKFEAIRKIRNYSLEGLCKRTTGRENYLELDSAKASKFISALDKILLYLQNPDKAEDRNHVGQSFNVANAGVDVCSLQSLS